jgi:hypothetical protein
LRGIPRIVLIICCVIIPAAAGVLAATWPFGPQPAGQHPAGQHVTVPPLTELPKPSCGSAGTHRVDGDTQVFAADRGALTCFGAAARGCRFASLEVTEMGVDTGTTYVFLVERGGTACQVTVLSQSYSANFGGSTGPVNAMACRRTAVTGQGVTLTCGGQDVLIPSAVGTTPLASAA